MKKNKAILPVILFLSIFRFTAFSIETIAVNTLSVRDLSRSEAISFTDALRSEIGKTGKYEVMERAKMHEILKEQGFQQTGACDDATCAIEMGKLLAVKYMVLGNVGKVGKTFTLNIRIVEVSSGKIINDITEHHKGSIDDLLSKVIPIAAQKLAGTYEEKRKPGVIIAISSVVAVAFIVPAIYIATKDSEPSSSDITIIWE
jgi:hypothetical protein